MRSRGICGIGVGEGAANGDGDGEAEGDVLGCAFCARKVTPMQQKTTTRRVRAMIIVATITRVRSKKRANGRAVKGNSGLDSREIADCGTRAAETAGMLEAPNDVK